MLTQRAASRRHRGLSLVELMVGIAVGLFVVASATALVATQLSDNRKLLVEAQVQQDLRAAADIIARDLRRAGYWSNALGQVWSPTSSGPVENPNRALLPSAGPTSILEYQYDRRIGGEALFGFCAGAACASSSSEHRIRTKFRITRADGTTEEAWHELTDSKVVKITGLSITPIDGPAAQIACPALCAGTNDTGCWPTLTVRELMVTITGEAANDPAVKRTVTSRVKLRNDLMTLNVPGVGAGNLPCPAQ